VKDIETAALASARNEIEVLKNRVAVAERTALAVQAELTRASQTASLTAAAPRDTAVSPVRPSATATPSRPTATAGVATPAPLAATTATPAPRIHTVALGETLTGISRQYYGTPNRWTDIFAANRDVIRDERSLVAGRTLRIP
jgi:nucleoid-associated protein YgaU